MGLMDGKRVLVAGARNRWSIGWHCAASLLREGATVAFSVLSERERGDIAKLLESAGAPECPIIICDATEQDAVDSLFAQVSDLFDGQLDGVVHSIAYAPREALSGEFVTTTLADFNTAMTASVYTLVALTRGARPLMQAAGGGSVVTLTYLGGDRAIPRYNVMGVCKAALESSVRYLAGDLGTENIRVNAVSAGPIKTLAAQGIQGFSDLMTQFSERSALHRKIETEEVGDTALFLLSPLARGITGEVVFVDGGFNMMG